MLVGRKEDLRLSTLSYGFHDLELVNALVPETLVPQNPLVPGVKFFFAFESNVPCALSGQNDG